MQPCARKGLPVDDIVKAAMAKWPNVPHCHGWLGLDARGQWYMRDDRCQRAGAFGSGLPQSKGALLRHDKLIAFIERNYLADADGCWYFQNGPQRVYVELEDTPWVWRIQPDLRVLTHSGQAASEPWHWLLDEEGRLYMACALGLGRVHSQDMALAAEAVEQGLWQPASEPMPWAHLPAQHGFVRSPVMRLTLQKT